MKKPSIAAALARETRPSPGVETAPPAARQRPTPLAPPADVHGNFPGGVYQDSVSQAVAPFMGGHQLPTGQTINVSMNAPSPHLSFKEWAGRGLVSALGAAAAWPFKLIGGVVEDIARMLVNLLGKLALFVLLPTMLLVGLKMAQQVSNSSSVEEGAAQIVHHGRHAANGVVSGMSDDLPAEKKDKKEKEKEGAGR